MISNREAYADFDWSQPIKRVILRADLDWGISGYNFYGLQLLQELRCIHQLRAPIFVWTGIPSTLMAELREDFMPIFQTPGHYLLDLADRPDQHPEWNSGHQLTELLLEEIVFLYLSRERMFQEIWSELRTQLRSADSPYRKVLLQKLYRITPVDRHDQLAIALQWMSEEQATASKASKQRLFDAHRNNIRGIVLAGRTTVATETDPKSRTWQVLYVDSDIAVASWLQESLAAEGIRCHTVSNPMDAMAFLGTDFVETGTAKRPASHSGPHNSVTVVIAAQRLKKPNGNWDTVQGHDLLLQIGKSHHGWAELIILEDESTPALNLLQAQVRVTAFSRPRIRKEGAELKALLNFVATAGQQVEQAIHTGPRAGYWNRTYKSKIEIPLVQLYAAHRSSTDYYELEQWINEVAMSWYRQAIELSKMQAEIELEGETLVLQTEIKKLDAKTQHKFRQKMVARRIALALCKAGWVNEDIAALLITGTTNEVVFAQQVRTLFTVHLSLSTDIVSDIPDYILPEERAFLHRMGFALNAREVFADEEED